MKLIFLDFDGVLNTPATWGKHLEGDGSGAIDPERVERVNRIVTATNAKVVISSTWRKSRTLEQLQELLKKRGATFDVYDVTPILRLARRGEIMRYVSRHGNIEEIVILDDDPDASIYGMFVHTDPTVGLTDADVDEAIAILGAKWTGNIISPVLTFGVSTRMSPFHGMVTTSAVTLSALLAVVTSSTSNY